MDVGNTDAYLLNMEAAFDELDLDGKGYIAREELQKGITEKGSKFESRMYPEGIEEFFKADADKDSKVTKEEFMNFVKNFAKNMVDDAQETAKMTDVDDGENDFKFEEPEVIDGVNVSEKQDGGGYSLDANEGKTLVQHSPRLDEPQQLDFNSADFIRKVLLVDAEKVVDLLGRDELICTDEDQIADFVVKYLQEKGNVTAPELV